LFVKYTRDGSFGVSSEDGGNFLVDSEGNYVLDQNGEKLSADDVDLKNKIGIFSFTNPRGLQNIGNNYFESTAQSGTAQAIEGNLKSGSLESSNVELNTEMTDMLEIQRAYQFNTKFIQTADEIENITNNLK
jgi:flagellar basal body rod protein FlgG